MRSIATLLAILVLPLAAVAQVAPAEETPGTPIEVEGIDVTGGSLFLGRAAYLRVKTGDLAVLSGIVRTGSSFGRTAMRGGSITFADSSTFNTRDSAFEVTGGNLQFKGGSTFRGGDSAISVDGGSILGFDGSALHIGGGSVIFSDSSTVTFRDSEFSVSGGSRYMRLLTRASTISSTASRPSRSMASSTESTGSEPRCSAELHRLRRVAVRSMSRRTTSVISSRLAVGSRISRVSSGSISGTGAKAVIRRTASVILDMRAGSL